MQPDRRELLENTFITVLEQFAFMFADLVPPEDFPQDRQPFVQAKLPFFGPFTGQLTIAVPEEDCVMFAANILGTDPDDSEAQADATDSIKEMVNVTTGQVLTAIAGEDVVFDLAIPVLHTLDSAQWQALMEDPETLHFLVDETPVLFHLRIDG